MNVADKHVMNRGGVGPCSFITGNRRRIHFFLFRGQPHIKKVLHSCFIAKVKWMRVVFHKRFICFIIRFKISDRTERAYDRFAFISSSGCDHCPKGLAKITPSDFGNLAESIGKTHMFFLFWWQR